MFNLSCVLIMPSALQSAGNALSIALGYGPDTYSVPLCTGETVTHYGAHAWVQQEFIDTIQSAAQGILPTELTTLDEDGNPPVAPADLQAILNNLIISAREGGNPAEHWNEVLAAHHLSQQVETPT